MASSSSASSKSGFPVLYNLIPGAPALAAELSESWSCSAFDAPPREAADLRLIVAGDLAGAGLRIADWAGLLAEDLPGLRVDTDYREGEQIDSDLRPAGCSPPKR